MAKAKAKARREIHSAGDSESAPWISIRQLAKETGISHWQLGEYIRKGAIPKGVVCRLGGRCFIIRQRWDEFIANGGLDIRKRSASAKAGR